MMGWDAGGCIPPLHGGLGWCQRCSRVALGSPREPVLAPSAAAAVAAPSHGAFPCSFGSSAAIGAWVISCGQLCDPALLSPVTAALHCLLQFARHWVIQMCKCHTQGLREAHTSLLPACVPAESGFHTAKKAKMVQARALQLPEGRLALLLGQQGHGTVGPTAPISGVTLSASV